MSLATRRLVAVVVVLLAALGAAVLLLRASGAPIALGPSTPQPTPTAEPTAAPTASPAASPDPSVEPGEVFAGIEEQVLALRELPAAEIGPPEVIGREALEAELREQFDADYPIADRQADNLSLRALGLLEEGQDYADLQLELLSAQVIGFYDDVEKRMVVVSDGGVDALAKITYAHEYTHALQDAEFGLDALGIDEDGQEDRALARLALVEGDATLTMLLWALEPGSLTPDELRQLPATPLPDTSGIPDWMLALLEFPYTTGADFVGQLYSEGGFAAVDEAYADPPDSTEQVIHAEKYAAREEPMAVELPDPAAALQEVGGCCWEVVESTPMGEAFIGIWLDALGSESSSAAAAGWGGDRLVVAGGPDGEFALVWRLAWDSAADADEFATAYREAQQQVAHQTRLVELSATELLVAHASDEPLLGPVVDAAR